MINVHIIFWLDIAVAGLSFIVSGIWLCFALFQFRSGGTAWPYLVASVAALLLVAINISGAYNLSAFL